MRKRHDFAHIARGLVQMIFFAKDGRQENSLQQTRGDVRYRQTSGGIQRLQAERFVRPKRPHSLEPVIKLEL